MRILRALALVSAVAALLPAQEQYVWLLPEGYHGWACVRFGVAGAPPLPREGGARLIRVWPDHDVETSDKTASYSLYGRVWFEANGQRQEEPEGTGSQRAILSTDNGRHCVFFGTVDEADAAKYAPGFQSVQRDFQPIPAEEREALIALYKATDGSHWTHHAGWLGPPGTECRWEGVGWHGVVCTLEDDRWHVVDLMLDRNRLDGAIPESIARLTHVRSIDLSENQLSSAVPETLGTLKDLEGLDLFGNHLSHVLPDALIQRWEDGSLDLRADTSQFTEVSQIEFDWSANSLLCARQRITLRADGTAVLLTERCRNLTPDDRTTFCEKKEGSLYWSRFAKLARLLGKSGFWELHTSYSRNVTHGGFETTRVTRNGKVYAVENYADAGPIELWTIQRAIEGAAFGIEWGKSTTQPECPAYEYVK
ncbi:MAG: hypothetical protein ABSH46_23230 [Bryobacteraceae bacterium]